MKLLLIEDDVRVAQVLADAFEADGHETAIRHTGEDGLAYLTSERPDAVVLDVRLPTMSGVAVLRRIRSIDPRLRSEERRVGKECRPPYPPPQCEGKPREEELSH